MSFSDLKPHCQICACALHTSFVKNITSKKIPVTCQLPFMLGLQTFLTSPHVFYGSCHFVVGGLLCVVRGFHSVVNCTVLHVLWDGCTVLLADTVFLRGLHCVVRGVALSCEGLALFVCFLRGLHCQLHYVLRWMHCVVRGLHCVVRGLHCVVRGLHCVVRGLRCVVRGLHCVIRGLYCFCDSSLLDL